MVLLSIFSNDSSVTYKRYNRNAKPYLLSVYRSSFYSLRDTYKSGVLYSISGKSKKLIASF